MSGSRRGQRQELAAAVRARFGRHPDCEVSFDAHRDIDASSRHAELRPAERAWVLVDLGSSNGTFVDGQRVTELAVTAGAPITVEFGPGGPRVRLFVGDADAVAALPAPVLAEPRRPLPLWLAAAGALVVALAATAWLVLR
ncbi:MAG: FHA domain-containing protein [Myxococcales bacterium]|nr:FHA domain-containing protein [Myxococcales bacterium]